MSKTSRIIIAIVFVCLTAVAGSQTSPPPPFQITTRFLPVPAAGQRYFVQLTAVGGKKPYVWAILGQPLPDGLTLDPQRGTIAGRPRTNDEFTVVIQVADSSEPPLTVTKQLVVGDSAPLAVRWMGSPQVSQSNLVGAVRVANSSLENVDTTVIVVAVNEIGKAFALRYEHFMLPPGAESPDLKFDVFVPNGQYTLHVDAVGEVASKHAIYRDRRQVDGLVVSQ